MLNVNILGSELALFIFTSSPTVPLHGIHCSFAKLIHYFKNECISVWKEKPGTNDIFLLTYTFPSDTNLRAIPSFSKPGPDKEEILDPDPKTPCST